MVESPPGELRPRGAGRRFWREIVARYELRADEAVLLRECCMMLDEIDALRAVSDPGDSKLLRLRQELRRSLGQLALPDEAAGSDDELRARRERETQASRRAQHAANVRWSRETP